MTLAESGHNIVTTSTLYGGTYNLFAHTLPRYGIEVRFAAPGDVGAMRGLMDSGTRAVFCESVGNPAGNVADLAALAELAHANGVPLMVDNTVPSPYLCRPFEHGADIVVHSLTKYMGGHGTTIGGVLVDSGQFPWVDHAERFPGLTQPDPSYHGVTYTDAFGPAAYIGARGWCRCATWARRSPPSTASRSCRASRPSRCAWTATVTTRPPWRGS